MTDSEFLLALSDIIRETIHAEFEPLREDIRHYREEMAERYFPSAVRCENEIEQSFSMQASLEAVTAILQRFQELYPKSDNNINSF